MSDAPQPTVRTSQGSTKLTGGIAGDGSNASMTLRSTLRSTPSIALARLCVTRMMHRANRRGRLEARSLFRTSICPSYGWRSEIAFVWHTSGTTGPGGELENRADPVLDAG